MERQKVGQVTPEERDEIQEIFNRKLGLQEIVKTLVSSNLDNIEQSIFYNRIIKDMGEVSRAYQKWWEDKSLKHKWRSSRDGKWFIDFDTCEIFLQAQ